MVGPGWLVTNSRWVGVCVVLRSSIEMRPRTLWGLAAPGPVIRTAAPAEWATRRGQLGFTLHPERSKSVLVSCVGPSTAMCGRL